MGMYNPSAPLVVGNEYAPVLYAPYTPDLFVERGWSFRLPLGMPLYQAGLYFDTVPSWAVPGHAYLLTVYARGQETNTGPLKTVTVPLVFVSNTNAASGGGAPTATSSIANPSDNWFYRLRSGTSGESYSRWRTGTIPTELSQPGLTGGKRIHDVSIVYTATAEPGNDAPVPLQINHYYAIDSNRVLYGNAQVDLVESLTTGIRRNRWGEICTWFRAGVNSDNSPFTQDISRAVWNYRLLTLFETGTDFTVEFRTESAAQDGPREIHLQYAAMQITYSEENRLASWGTVLGADYSLVNNGGAGGGYRFGRNTQGPTNGIGFNEPNFVWVNPGGGSSQSGGVIPNVFDATITVKRADYGPYNNQGPAGQIRALRTVDVFPGHPGVVINNTLEPGQSPTIESSDLLPQIVLQSEGTPVAPGTDLSAAPYEFGHTYGRQRPLEVYLGHPAVQGIVPAAEAPNTPFDKVRFWARSNNAKAALRLEVDTADQGPVTVAQLEPSELEQFPEVADGWRQIDLEVDPDFLIDDWSQSSGTRPVVQSSATSASGTTGAWNATAPAGNLEGRLLLLLHGVDTSTIASMGTPTGGTTWNILQQTQNFNAGNGAARLWWKIGGPAEPASYGLTQNSGADGMAVTVAIENGVAAGMHSAGFFFDPPGTNGIVTTPDVPIDGAGALDLRFGVGLFSGATWTAPSQWTPLETGGTPFVSAGLFVRESTVTNNRINLTSSVANSLGRFGITVTVAAPITGPGAPRWESDTTAVEPWEVLGARVVDPNLSNDVFDGTAPAEMGIGTYGGAMTQGGIEGSLPVTADIDAAVVWGQQLPEIEGLSVEIQLQPLAVVDPDCPAVPRGCTPDGLQYYRISWDAIEDGYGFVGLGYYELQRRDDTMDLDEWETVAQAVHPLAVTFDDYEFRVGVDSWYRIRYVQNNGMAGDWTEVSAPEIVGPGVTGAGAARGVLMFTSNVDPGRNLAYVQVWNGSPEETFSFVESANRDLQQMYGRDYQVAFRPAERGGVAFSRSLLVHAASIPVETLAEGFTSLRDLAWADLPYVCVRTERSDRWFTNVNVPGGSIRMKRKLYVAEVDITEVAAEPFPVELHYCEGMTARGALPSTIYEPRFATTPDRGQFGDADISLQVQLRLDQMNQRIPLAGRFERINLLGWYFAYYEDQTLEFFIQGTGFDSADFESAPVPFGAGDLFWVRVDYDPDGGGATSTAQFYTSPDGVVWNPLATTMLGNDSVPGNDPVFDGLPMTVGALGDGTTNLSFTTVQGTGGGWNGVIRELQYLGDGGGVIANPKFFEADPAATQFLDSEGNRWSVTGGVCTVDRRL